MVFICRNLDNLRWMFRKFENFRHRSLKHSKHKTMLIFLYLRSNTNNLSPHKCNIWSATWNLVKTRHQYRCHFRMQRYPPWLCPPRHLCHLLLVSQFHSWLPRHLSDKCHSPFQWYHRDTSRMTWFLELQLYLKDCFQRYDT